MRPLSGLADLLSGRRPLGPLGNSILIAAPVVAAALFYVWTHITTVSMGYALSEAGATHKKLLERNRALRIEAAALRSPDRLERIAKEQFGFTAPNSEQVVKVARR